MSDVSTRRLLASEYDSSWFPGIPTTPPPVVPDPHIDSLVPNTSVVGQPVTVTINGTNFEATSVVEADGAALPTVFVSATRLTVSGTPIVDGTAEITVRNVSGAESNSVTYTVTLVADDGGTP